MYVNITLDTFNSIKVQLRPCRDEKQDFRTPFFQFHKGTIKALMKQLFFTFLLSFNSIKVQLRLSGNILS